MLFDILKNDSTNYIHLASLLRTPFEVLESTKDSLLIHFFESDIYIAETTNKNLTSFIALINLFKPEMIETTNIELFNQIRINYLNSYTCYQYGPFIQKKANSNLKILKDNDLNYVISTYHNEKYIRQLYKRNRILGYYVNSNLVGYITKHIDGTLGALYVDPKYRQQGYGKIIIKASTAFFDDPLIYSQVIDDNVNSIKLHNSLHIHQSKNKICWMYNKEFSFK